MRPRQLIQTSLVKQISAASISNYKQKINALFAAATSPIPTSVMQPNTTLKEAYLNELHIQTLPKTKPDDIVVTYFYFRNGAPTANSSALDQLIDFVLTEKGDRSKDFFLRADNGVNIDILFKYILNLLLFFHSLTIKSSCL
jgi:hypothetical protein